MEIGTPIFGSQKRPQQLERIAIRSAGDVALHTQRIGLHQWNHRGTTGLWLTGIRERGRERGGQGCLTPARASQRGRERGRGKIQGKRGRGKLLGEKGRGQFLGEMGCGKLHG